MGTTKAEEKEDANHSAKMCQLSIEGDEHDLGLMSGTHMVQIYIQSCSKL